MKLERLGLSAVIVCAGLLGLGAVISSANAGPPPVLAALPTLAAAPRSVLELPPLPDAIAPVRQALVEGDAMRARWLADQGLSALALSVAAGADAADIGPLVLTVAELRADAMWSLQPPPRGHQGTFLRRLVPGATLGDWKYGVPASITLAQAILESNWGRSAPGYNLFGLKGKGPAGSTERRVVEYRSGKRQHRIDPFRAYHSEAEALADHARILGTRARYAKARSVSHDRRAYARALVGIYASDPRYAQKLDRLIVSLGLDRFDWEPVEPLTPADPTFIPDSPWQALARISD